MTRLLFIVAAVCLIAPSSRGAILIDKGTPQNPSYDMSGFENADDFTFSSTHSIGAVRFWVNVLAPTQPVFYRFYDNGASGAPGNLLGSGSATPVASGIGADFVQIDFTLSSPVTLPAGTFYLSLHDGPYNVTPAVHHLWASSGPGSHFMQPNGVLTPPAEPQTTNELAFQLFDTATTSVPEPSTAMFLAGSLVLVAFGPRRKV